MKTLKSEQMVANSGKTVVMPETDDIECTVISSGKQVCFRPMVAKDLLVMERLSARPRAGKKGQEQAGMGEIEMSIRLMERLSVSPGKITVVELEKLAMKDFQAISSLLSLVSGTDDKEDDYLEDGLGNE